MDPKLTLRFMLIAFIMGLSHLGDQSFGRVQRMLPTQRWRNITPGWRRH